VLDPASNPAARLVAEVGAQLVRLSNAARSPYADNFHFHLLGDPETVNAFALPGGQIFITRGLFVRLANEAQVAAVLAHEIGHVIHRHSAEQMAKGQLGQTLTVAVGVASDDGRRGEMVAAAVNQMIQLKYGRGDESEADHYGLEAMAGAGYDPTAMLDVMRVLRAAAGDQRPPEFLSSHPLPETRLREIEEILRQTYPGGVPAALTKGRPLRNTKAGSSN
jgi:beta-barrel assembly-enhancing protease